MLKKNKILLSWKNDKKIKSNIKISEFPNSNKFLDYTNICRSLINDFFNNKSKIFNDIYFESYFKKLAELEVVNVYALKSLAKSDFDNLKNFHLTKYYFGNIILNNIPKRKNKIITISNIIFFTFIFLSKNLIKCIFTFNKIHHPDVLFIRKKNDWDNGLSKSLMQKLSNSFSTSLLGFSSKKSVYNFNYLNQYKGSTIGVIKCFFYIFYNIKKINLICSELSLEKKTINKFIRDIFYAKQISFIKSKIYTGVLIDKPVFVLMYKYKSNNQKMHSINESWQWHPYRNFDYNFLDCYYGNNPIDSKTINKFGGEIKEYFNVPFFRNNLLLLNQDISTDLKNMINLHKKVILLATVQISYSQWSWYDKQRLDNFLLFIIKITKLYPNFLFILKEKKNELLISNKTILENLYRIENLYIVRSIKPKTLPYNQFETLLKISSLFISMNSGSTTLLQSLFNNIPFIAINDDYPKTFFYNFKFSEVTYENIFNAIDYWLNVNLKTKEERLNTIKEYINMTNNDGIQIIANHITKSLFKINKQYDSI